MKPDYTALTGGVTGALVSLAGMNLETAEHWVNIGCAIIGVVIAIVSGLIIPLLRWYKEAKKDGKIDIDEIEDAAKIVTDGLEKTSDAIKDITKENDNAKD